MRAARKKQIVTTIIILVLLLALAATIFFSSARIKTLEATAFGGIGREYAELYYRPSARLGVLLSEIDDFLETGSTGALYAAGSLAFQQSWAWNEVGASCFRYAVEAYDREHRTTLRSGDTVIDINYTDGSMNDIADSFSDLSAGFGELYRAIRYIMTEGREYAELTYSFSDCVDYLKTARASLDRLSEALTEGQEKYQLHDINLAWTQDEVVKLMALCRDLNDFASGFNVSMQFPAAYAIQ